MTWEQISKSGVGLAKISSSNYWNGGSSKTELRPMAANLGVTRVEMREMGENGAGALLVQRPDGGSTVFLNKSASRLRQRVSLAHELAHLLLRGIVPNRAAHRQRFSPTQDPDGQRLEELCDLMALSILMPERRLRGFLKPSAMSAAPVPRVAQVFDVPFDTVAQRFVNVSTDPCGFIFWRRLDSGTPMNTREPFCSPSLGNHWLEIKPSSASFSSLFSRSAALSERITVTYDSIVIAGVEKIDKAPVESFGPDPQWGHLVSSFVNLAGLGTY